MPSVTGDNSWPQLRAAVETFARGYAYDAAHAAQVAQLAVNLFDGLRAVHGLERADRTLLQVAALVHDIGWSKGRARHHKTARDSILSDPAFPLLGQERVIIALLARYHRRSVPHNGHKFFRDLSPDIKQRVRGLAALLRVADGLDAAHQSRVNIRHCRVEPGAVTVVVDTARMPDEEQQAAQEKADLFTQVFHYRIRFAAEE